MREEREATNSSERIMYAVEGASLHKKGEERRERRGLLAAPL